MTKTDLLERDKKQLLQQQQESLRLLKACVSQVGMVLGEELNAHIAELSGTHFNRKEYLYEKPVGEQ
jgi:Asp-tRNA(Asn)/Glu-tRNA(Gln) amidotransferase B subunit